MSTLQRWYGPISRVVLSALLLGGGVAGFVALGKRQPESRQPENAAVAVVQVVEAAPHEDGITFEVDGLVVPFRDIEIAAEVQGRVIEKSPQCRMGRTVQQGEVLLQLDRRDYEIEIRRLGEQLEQADGNLAELDVQLANAERQIATAREDLQIANRELKRYETSVDPGVFSASEVDAARRNELTARDALQDVQDQLRLLEASKRRLQGGRETVQANLERAELDLERTTIRAPLTGVVTEDEIEQDGYVQRGTPIVTIRDSSSLDVRCSLHTHQLNWLRQARSVSASAASSYQFPETPVRVRYQIDGCDFYWPGVLQRYEGVMIDERTRMIPCRVFVSDPLGGQCEPETAAGCGPPPALMVGMFVEVQVQVTPRVPLVRVPRTALHPGDTVWVVENEQLSRRRVRIAESEADHVLIYARSGELVAGEPIVVSPLSAPHNGVAVQVLPST